MSTARVTPGQAVAVTAMAGLLASCGSPDVTQPTPPTLSGTVVSAATRSGVAGVQITAHAGGSSATARTDDSGSYTLAGLIPGAARVEAIAQDFDPQTTDVTPVPGTNSLDLRLRRTPCAVDACGPQRSACNESIPFLRPPVEEQFPAISLFDHRYPLGFGGEDGQFESYCGSAGRYDGHRGWDWLMPTGTTVVAAADGFVTLSGNEPPFHCPFLNRTVSGLFIDLQHRLPSGEILWTRYLHLDRIDVSLGATVAAGQPLGVSGNTGCSTLPHLHFEVLRQHGNVSRAVVDPNGWQGAGEDPWALHSNGAASVWLWQRDVWFTAASGVVVRDAHSLDGLR